MEFDEEDNHKQLFTILLFVINNEKTQKTNIFNDLYIVVMTSDEPFALVEILCSFLCSTF